MPSPFSNKNLPFLVFIVVAFALVFVLVFKPFQSSFGESPVQNYMGAPTGMLSEIDKAVSIQNANQFGSMDVSQASGNLDRVIKDAKIKLDPIMLAGINNNELNNLYSQANNTLNSAISYRETINSNTSVSEIITWSATLSDSVLRFTSKKGSIYAL